METGNRFLVILFVRDIREIVMIMPLVPSCYALHQANNYNSFYKVECAMAQSLYEL